jgi:ATP-dependent Zn protease|nr:MAG TPA: WXG100 protein secretion system protein [Caudoviricetes sp.]
MEEIIIPVIIVAIIQIVLIILFVQATMNIKRIYELLYNKFENDRQEKIEAKQKEAQTEQGNQNSEPQSLAQLREQLMAQAQSSSYNDNDDEDEENSNVMTIAKWILGISVIIFIIVGLYAVLS